MIKYFLQLGLVLSLAMTTQTVVISEGVRNDGRCGPGFPLEGGSPATCDPDSPDFCCSSLGWCGGMEENCTTNPDSPTQLSINVQSSTVAVVRWDPPNSGSFSGFKLKVIPLSEPSQAIKNIQTLDQQSTLKDLTPGATYEIQLYSEYEEKESAYISTNFTTKPNTPGRFQVWFRNETTLLVLWQPPYPAGYYTDYKVSIKPEDSIHELYVHRESEPGSPSQAAFLGLVPGRAYNISVATYSDGQISDPSWAVYRTVPLRPHNVTFDQASIGPDFFSVRWSGPTGTSEFDRYQVAIGTRRKTPQFIEKGQPLVARFAENLTPGWTYQVVVKTVSGSVASWPATGNVTTQPLPVNSIREEQEAGPGSPRIVLTWQPNSESQQDSYRIEYSSSSVTVEEPRFYIDKLQRGRNYSIAIRAVSNGMLSRATLYNLTTEDA